MRHDKKQVNKGTDITSSKNVTTKKYELLTDKSNKLLMQMQEELDMLQRQHEEESKRHKKWLEELNNDKKQEDAHNAAEQHSHVEYLLHKKREGKSMHVEKDRIKSKRRHNYLNNAEDAGGFSIKGTSLQNFSESKSIQKKLRKPEVSLPEIMNAGKVTLRNFMTGIRAVESPMNGRLNADTILLRVIK